MRNALSLVSRDAQQMVGPTIRTAFAQPDTQSAYQQWRRVADGFRTRFPKLVDLMNEAEEDVPAYASFPAEHWQKIWSNNRTRVGRVRTRHRNRRLSETPVVMR